jgi:SAM-dependent methyltransferase
MTRTAVLAAFDTDRVNARAPSFEPVACYYCGGRRVAPFITAEDDLTGRPGRFAFVRCMDCSLVYQSPRPTLAHVKTYYDEEYLAHRSQREWGWMSGLFASAMRSLDRRKLSIVNRHVALGSSSRVLDVGCGAGTFLAHVHATHGSAVSGVDFVNLADRPALRDVDFRCGLFSDQRFGDESFDVVTMWHFLEHDYDPLQSLEHARRLLRPEGCLVVEVPRLDSLTFRLFGDRWPGLQAPQHTVLYDRAMLVNMMSKAGLDVVEYLPFGAFPPYFYLFCGAAFRLLKGRGLNMRVAIYPYFAGQLLLLPVLPLLDRMNFAMQTVVCRRRDPHGAT